MEILIAFIVIFVLAAIYFTSYYFNRRSKGTEEKHHCGSCRDLSCKKRSEGEE
ncbi:MAG: hypothetical protein FWE36_07720 [Erysipelotrichales bacterium]|nr:hypothetical protein [Erysipelotrichales bacterium]